ncbi:MAG: hypothetical protein J5857_10925 [Treponema sp.]|nr:hypothetical protein [Treponema sp.]
MKKKLFVVSLMVLFAALFVSCADGLKGSMEGHSYGSGGHSGAGGGGYTSGGTTFLSGTTWVQTGYDLGFDVGYDVQIPNPGSIVFASSGNKVTTTMSSQRLTWDYEITDSRTAEFTMYGSTVQSFLFVIDEYDENRATWQSFVWTKQ